ncbi:DUF2070 family protein [Ignisphaera sp. 4213-co]|uniref:DUF2070 family protein n=1 Tax=Ignisphaera cupida TaxID=3050454 RepID=A0ABD4Z4W1_9CREN|nr:DUF2070 family protein [Ignisphaera sp. 4213-co]MDK6028244.1 DUF2070 family protein [Ignisphaera sp. 4213-co]
MLEGVTLKYYRFLRIPSAIAKKFYIAYITLFLLLFIADVYPFLFLYAINLMFLYKLLIIHVLSMLILILFMKISAKYMKTRQIVNAIVFIVSVGVPLEFISSPIGLYGIAYAIIPLIGTITLVHLAGLFKGLIYVVFVSIAIESMFSYVDSFKFVLLRFSLVLILLLVSVSIVMRLNKVGNYNVLKIANAWIRFMLSGDGNEIEEALDNIGIEFNAQMKIFLFERKTDAIALITPTIHFGPYKNIGSTYLPYDIESVFTSKKLKVLVFHGAGSHELDLTKRAYGVSLARELASRIVEEKDRIVPELVYEPFRVFNGLREALAIQTDSTALIIISSTVTGGDDLPYELQKFAESITRLYGFRDVVIVDAHNLEGKRELDVSQFSLLVKAALSKRSKVCEEFMVGYGESSIKEHVYVKGICRDVVKALTMRCNENLYSIIYLYGNNAKVGVRDALRKVAIENGCKDAEVVTLDDHTCAGSVFDAPYYSIELSNSLIDAVKNALNVSINDLKPATVKYLQYESKVKVAGNKIYELLDVATRVGSIIVKYLKISLPLLYFIWLVLVLIIKTAII